MIVNGRYTSRSVFPHQWQVQAADNACIFRIHVQDFLAASITSSGLTIARTLLHFSSYSGLYRRFDDKFRLKARMHIYIRTQDCINALMTSPGWKLACTFIFVPRIVSTHWWQVQAGVCEAMAGPYLWGCCSHQAARRSNERGGYVPPVRGHVDPGMVENNAALQECV